MVGQEYLRLTVKPHDRTAFHFLTDEKEQNAYIRHLKQALRVGGHLIIETFALDFGRIKFAPSGVKIWETIHNLTVGANP